MQNICLIPRCFKCLVHVENTTAGDQGVSRNGQWEHQVLTQRILGWVGKKTNPLHGTKIAPVALDYESA